MTTPTGPESDPTDPTPAPSADTTQTPPAATDQPADAPAVDTPEHTETDPTQTDEPQEPAAAAAPKTPFMQRLVRLPIAVGVAAAALIVGGAIGAGAMAVPLTNTSSDLDLAKTRQASAERNAEAAESDYSDLEDAVAEERTRIQEREDELDQREAAIKVDEQTFAANSIPGDGTFVVGKDVQPGRYQSTGNTSCYWARLNANGDDIIDNDISSGSSVVTVAASDGLIKTSGCNTFTKIG